MHSSQLMPCYQVICLTTLILKTLKIFITETEFWLRIALSTASAPHQGCQHKTKGALLLAQTEQTCGSSGASSYCHSWRPSHDLRPVTRSTPQKIAPGISPLAFTSKSTLSPSEVTQHLAPLLLDALLTTSSHLAGPVLPFTSSGAILFVYRRASQTSVFTF